MEQFDLDVPRTSQNYVVEAMLLDDDRYQRVVLSKINGNGKTEPVIGARVILESDKDSAEIVFNGDGTGRYAPSGMVNLRKGERFRITVYPKEDTRIVSEWEEVPEAVSIESGYWEPHTFTLVNDNGVTVRRNGINFLVNTSEFKSADTYLRYVYETTHINEAPFRSSLCDCLNCYITIESKDFLTIASAMKSEGKSLKDQLITFLPLDRKFSFRLTMLVRQMAITKNAFLFYQAIDQQRSLNGSIFDPPPAIINGNLSYEGNEQVNVYGLFELGRMSEYPITIYKSNIENQFLTYLDVCNAGARARNIESFCFNCYAEEGAGARPYYYTE